jgi:Response regulator containing a CheY-like receiver domain and an HTH DNA-binding domain
MQPQTATSDPADLLTPMQMKAAQLAAEGLTIDEIAGVMHVGPRTVKHQLEIAKARLGVTHKRQIRARMKELKLLD